VAALETLDEKTRTVLIVDDNPDDANLIRRILEAKKAYRVFHALNGDEGLQMAREKLPDLIISDLTMPERDGFTMLEALKSDERTHTIPVVVVSARDITPDERRRLSGQVEALYQKGSLSPRAFVEQVVQVMDDKPGTNGQS
jgi:threonine synthase